MLVHDHGINKALTGRVQQVSTYKIVTVNASRHTSDPMGSNVGSRQMPMGSRLTSHPEHSATIEQEIYDEELHSPVDNAKDEMQTWMLLEVSGVLVDMHDTCAYAITCTVKVA